MSNHNFLQMPIVDYNSRQPNKNVQDSLSSFDQTMINTKFPGADYLSENKNLTDQESELKIE